MIMITISIVNIKFFQNPDIECEDPVKIQTSDFIRVALYFTLTYNKKISYR